MKRNRGLSFILILTGIIFLSACKKEDKNVGIDIQPPNDRLGVLVTDTVSIYAYSQLVDSVRTSGTSTNPLGSMYDPIFGTTTADMYVQFRLSQTAVSFGENPVLDSLVLTLDYSGIYGDSSATLTVDVYEMSEGISADSDYYSNQSVAYYPDLITSKTFVTNVTDSVVVNGDTLAPHIRINLSATNTQLAEKLLNATDEDLNTQDAFHEFFQGLYLKVHEVSSGGAITYIDLPSTLSEMVLIYHNDEEDSLYYPFIISNYSAYFSHFSHNYMNAEPGFKAQVLDGDTALGRTTLYTQSMAGVKTFFRFPNLKDLEKDGKIAVNEARLFVKIQEDDPLFKPATSLVVVKSDGEGGYTILTDQLEGLDYFGGIYDKNTGGYWFRITTAIQDILSSDDPDYGFDILLSGASVNAQRSILTGYDPQAPVPQEDRMKLVITYSKII